MRKPWRVMGAIWLGGLLAAHAAWADDPDVLWKVVSGACVPHAADGGDGRPCALVDLAAGYAILKDLNGATHFLLIPTAKVSGIESPTLFMPDAPRYWDQAWKARRFVSERAGRNLARDEIGLAINSIDGRTQNQLHIHIDCVRPELRLALRAEEDRIGDTWRPLRIALRGHAYQARRLMQLDLESADPFRLLANGLAGARADMGLETLVVTGTVFHDGGQGFYLLADRADPALGDRASGDELLDHTCALAG